MSDELNKCFKETKNLNEELLSLAGKILKAGDIFPVDLMTMAVVNRSIELSDGFKLLIEARKILCVAPILRLQLDNLLRYSAVWLVDNPHNFCLEVAKGIQIKSLKDSSGEKMTDFYLVRKLSNDIHWVKSVYDKTCGYVHFSESHFRRVTDGIENDGRFSIGVGKYSKSVPESLYIEAAKAFNAATIEICKYVYGWLKTKDGSVDLSTQNKAIKNDI